MKKQYKHLLSILISLQLLGLPTTQAGWGSAVRRFFKKSQAETLKTVPHLGEQGLRSLNKSAHSFISEFGEDLSEKAARGDLSELIGRETDLAQSENILSSDLSLFIEGQPGVGVEDIVNGLVYKTVHHSDLIDPHLKGRRFININLDKFLAGTTNKRGTEQIMNEGLERLQKAL